MTPESRYNALRGMLAQAITQAERARRRRNETALAAEKARRTWIESVTDDAGHDVAAGLPWLHVRFAEGVPSATGTTPLAQWELAQAKRITSKSAGG